MAQGPGDTILVPIRITLRIRESKVRNPDPLDRRRFVLSEHSFFVGILLCSIACLFSAINLTDMCQNGDGTCTREYRYGRRPVVTW